jgi:hypothetical protein
MVVVGIGVYGSGLRAFEADEVCPTFIRVNGIEE